MQKLNKIMVIDDNHIDSKLTRIIIQRSGVNAKIVEFRSAEEALNTLQMRETNPPQLIFLDINMPKMDGLAFLQAYRNLTMRQRDKIIIVMLTASANPQEQKQALSCGTVKTLLPKPLTHANIVNVMQNYFN